MDAPAPSQASQLPQGFFIGLESEAGLFKCFRTPATGVILYFTSTAKGRLKATLNAPIVEPHHFLLEPFEARRFANLCGQFDEHLRLIEQRLGIEIRNRGNQFELIGDAQPTKSAENLLRRLYRETKGSELSPETVHLYLQESAVEDLANNPVAEASVALGFAVETAQQIFCRFSVQGLTNELELIAAIVDLDAQALFDQAQVLVELSAQVGETESLKGLEDKTMGFYYGCVQGRF